MAYPDDKTKWLHRWFGRAVNLWAFFVCFTGCVSFTHVTGRFAVSRALIQADGHVNARVHLSTKHIVCRPICALLPQKHRYELTNHGTNDGTDAGGEDFVAVVIIFVVWYSLKIGCVSHLSLSKSWSSRVL